MKNKKCYYIVKLITIICFISLIFVMNSTVFTKMALSKTLEVNPGQDWVKNSNPHSDKQNIGHWKYLASSHKNPTDKNSKIVKLKWENDKYVYKNAKNEIKNKTYVTQTTLKPSINSNYPYVVKRYQPDKILSEGILVRIKGYFERRQFSDKESKVHISVDGEKMCDKKSEVHIYVDGKKKFSEIISKQGDRVYFDFLTKIEPESKIDFIVGSKNKKKKIKIPTFLNVSIKEKVMMSYKLGDIKKDWKKGENPHLSWYGRGEWSYSVSSKVNPRSDNSERSLLKWSDNKNGYILTNSNKNIKNTVFTFDKNEGSLVYPFVNQDIEKGKSYAVRTFTASVSGYVKIRGHFKNVSSYPGIVKAYIYLDGKRIYSKSLKQEQFESFNLRKQIKKGSKIDFVIGTDDNNSISPKNKKLAVKYDGIISRDTYPHIANSSSEFGINWWNPREKNEIDYDPDGIRKGKWTYLASSQPNANDTEEADIKNLLWDQSDLLSTRLNYGFNITGSRDPRKPYIMKHKEYGDIMNPGGYKILKKIINDKFLPPQKSGILGKLDMSKTIFESKGWEYATEKQEMFFGDDSRKVRSMNTNTHLIWNTDSINKFEITIYSKAKKSEIKPLIKLAVSPEQENWTNVNYQINNNKESNNWYKFKITGRVREDTKSNYFKFSLGKSNIPYQNIQLGQLQLYKYSKDLSHPYVIRRWTSGIKDKVLIKAMFDHLSINKGQGVKIFIFYNNKLIKREELYHDSKEFVFNLNVNPGDKLDFVVGPKKDDLLQNNITRNSVKIEQAEPRYLGKLSPFWRRNWDARAWKGSLYKIPSYLTDKNLDYPVPQRSNEKEIPFTDRVSVVRPIGSGRRGGPWDIIYEKNGEYHYRWDNLKERLDSTINYGYDHHVIVLNNTPWCFPENPTKNHYGQAQPPADYDFWYSFIKKVCQKLKKWYPEISNNFRFRLGAEFDHLWPENRTTKELKKFYDYTMAAVHEVFPEAEGVPTDIGNQTNLNFSENRQIINLAKHAQSGLNYKTGEKGSPFDYVPVTYSYRGKENTVAKKNQYLYLRSMDPDERTFRTDWFWDAIIDGETPALDSGKFLRVNREVQQYGVFDDIDRMSRVHHTGAYGGALDAYTLINWLCIGVEGGWQWWPTGIEYVRGKSEQGLLASDGWVYTIWQQMIGSKMYKIPVNSISNHNTRYKAVYSINKKEQESMIMLSSYNINPIYNIKEKVDLKIPQSILPESNKYEVDFLKLNSKNAVYDVLYKDLKENNLLNPDFDKPHQPTSPIMVESRYPRLAGEYMGKRGAWDYVDKHFSKYQSIIEKSLTLKEWKGSLPKKDSDWNLNLELTPPSVMVLVLKWE